MAKKKSFWDLDKIANGLLNLLDPNIANRERLSTKEQKMQNVLNREMDISKGVSNGSILEFDLQMRKDAKKSTKKSNDDFVDNRKLVSENLGDIFSIYSENYKNKYLEIQDLKFVCRIIPALGEAVRTTLNAMCSADTISNVLSRTINLPSALTESDKETVMKFIENFEKTEKLKKVLKNQVFKNGLITGTQVVYVKPYKEIFNEYEEIKKKGIVKGRPSGEEAIATNKRRTHKAAYLNAAEESLHGLDFATESYMNLGDDTCLAMESCINIDALMESITSVDKDTKKEINDQRSHISNFFILDSSIPIPVMEAVQAKTSFNKYFESNVKPTTDQIKFFADGATDEDEEKKKNAKLESYDSETGLYIKPLDYKKLIPYAPMNEVVGYFYVHCEKKKLKENLAKNKGLGSLNTLNSEQLRKDKLVDDIVSSITNQILDKFSSKFVADHSEFKHLIADCIISNGFVDKDYKIQFIPAQDVIEFNFNEDEEGQGQSVLIDSLFPAKLLASLLIAKHMNYINKAGDKMMMYLHKGATTMQTGNRAEQIIRNLQTADVNFADYGSSSVLFSKLSRNSNFEVPTGKSGNHLVEFEKWDGQQVDMNTEYEQYLNRMTILGTGVPSTILEYIDTQDFAKQTETANIKFAQHITGLQGDATEPLTELYRRAILSSSLPDNIKQLIVTSSEFEVKLPTPKVLSITNTADSFNTIKSLAEQVTDTIMLIDDGGNLDDKTSKMIRSKLISKIMNEEAPHVNWELYLKMYREARIEVEKNIDERKETSEDGTM